MDRKPVTQGMASNQSAEYNPSPEMSDKDMLKDVPAEQDNPSSSEVATTSDPYTFCVFKEESQLKVIKGLIEKELSEPYTIYTYRYFAYNWPDLCVFALEKDRYVGVIVCKLEMLLPGVKQGYIAMLAVDVAYRKRGIGKALATMAIEMMAVKDAAIIALETEITNKAALALYESLGFIRERRMMNYYMNGTDAFRLKLLLHGSLNLRSSED